MTRDMRKEITADPDLHQFLLMHGALPCVESWIKGRRGQARDEVSHPEQLVMEWPQHVRPIVEAIDRDALYVPSIDEYVPLQPDQIDKGQLREAAQHLRTHAEDTMRIAVLVERLADEL